MLSPMLAVAAHINIGFVPLVFVPLYAVQRMAKLVRRSATGPSRIDPLTGLANRTGLKLAFARSDRPDTETRAARSPCCSPTSTSSSTSTTRSGTRSATSCWSPSPTGWPCCRSTAATIARLGGDEFAFIAPVAHRREANDLAVAVVAALSEPISLDGLQVDVTASVGIAIHTDGEDFATLMRHADIAMYDAKQRGGDIAAYEPGAHQDSLERLALLTDFRRALENRRQRRRSRCTTSRRSA